MSYDIGTALLTSTSYLFTQDPFCDYPQTDTVDGLPSFVTYDSLNARFIVPETSDLSLVGVYTFIIRSEISMPVDYTMSSETVLSDE